MRLIDADKLEQVLTGHSFSYCGESEWNEGVSEGLLLARLDAQEAPTIDAPQVVRCKDCKYWQRSKIKGNRNHDYHICLNSRHGYCIISFENDYCSRGRRAK